MEAWALVPQLLAGCAPMLQAPSPELAMQLEPMATAAGWAQLDEVVPVTASAQNQAMLRITLRASLF